MNISQAKSRILRFDINEHRTNNELSVDIISEVDVNDYLTKSALTIVIIWKIYAVDTQTHEEVIGYLNQTTAIITNPELNQDDILLLKRLAESSFLAAERLFQQRYLYQNKLPPQEYFPIAAELMRLILPHLIG